MNRNRKEALRLMAKLDVLMAKQKGLMVDAEALKKEIARLHNEDFSAQTTETDQLVSTEKEEVAIEQPKVEAEDKPVTLREFQEKVAHLQKAKTSAPQPGLTETSKPRFTVGKSLEKFIGENLINKIGIGIIILGVGIGAKYSIDNNLISPLTRILLGYLVGLGLIGFGIRLKANYTNFSAVLVSGAMTIMYFLTFFAYDFYGLIPTPVAFGLMVLFTIFTVIAALQYNNQIIAQLGLVGAYAVPFLLGGPDGSAHVLFSYMVIINGGILVTAFYKNWKPLQYSAFVLTWIIFFSWVQATEDPLGTILLYSTLFFVTFYVSALAYKIIKNETYNILDIVLVLLNAFVFYIICYVSLENYDHEPYLGLMTIVHALIHFGVSILIFKKNLADKSLKEFTLGLVLVFLTIAIPVQLSGTWIPVLWSVEAAILFWLSSTRSNRVFEILSYPIMVFAVITVQELWINNSFDYYLDKEVSITPFINVGFLSSVLFVASFVVINLVLRRPNYKSTLPIGKSTKQLLSFVLPAVLFYGLFASIRLEIGHIFDNMYASSLIELSQDVNGYSDRMYNRSIRLLEQVWSTNYALIFVAGLAFYNIRAIKSRVFGIVNMVLLGLSIIVFLTSGLYSLSILREEYLSGSEFYDIGVSNILIRYISILIVLASGWVFYQLTRAPFMKLSMQPTSEIGVAVVSLWLLTSEFINILTLAGSDNSYKLGLSILWGVFALSLVVLGIWQQKKHLRIAAISLFGVTLAKLFFYDIAHLSTIAKTVVFVTLGAILLIISFLYNKYKKRIEDEV